MPFAPRQSLPRFSDRLPLGKTGLQVSPFCVGMVGDDPETVEAAFDAGINFFFLSGDLHWIYYDVARRGLARLLARRPSLRSEIVVAVCSYAAHPAFVSSGPNEVVASVPGLERADVLVVGGARELDLRPRVEFAQELRARGFVSSVAATLHERAAGVTAHNQQLVDAAFIRYNPAHPGARTDLFPALDPASSTLLFNFKNVIGHIDDARWAALGLGADHWRPAATDYYRYVLTRPELDGLLCAPATPAQVHALARAMELPPLDDEEQTYLEDLVTLASGKARLKG